MPLNAYVTLGHSGLRVSRFCLGGMTFGDDLEWGSTVADSEANISRYLDAGGNFVDTANIYTRGHSEAIIGDFFVQRKGRRDRVVIDTKFFCNIFAGDPNGAARAAKRSSRSATNRCADCRPITSTSTICTTGIDSRRSKKR